MSVTLQLNTSIVGEGLGTSTYIVESDGEYRVAVQATIPSGSRLAIGINSNNSSTLAIGGSSNSPTPTQKAIGSSIDLQCVADDQIDVVLSSSVNADSLPNAVKSVITLTKLF